MSPNPSMHKSVLPLAIAAALATGAPQVSAQLEEVIVTAQKREQSLIDVPISIATLSGDAHDTRSVR